MNILSEDNQGGREGEHTPEHMPGITWQFCSCCEMIYSLIADKCHLILMTENESLRQRDKDSDSLMIIVDQAIDFLILLNALSQSATVFFLKKGKKQI